MTLSRPWRHRRLVNALPASSTRTHSSRMASEIASSTRPSAPRSKKLLRLPPNWIAATSTVGSRRPAPQLQVPLVAPPRNTKLKKMPANVCAGFFAYRPPFPIPTRNIQHLDPNRTRGTDQHVAQSPGPSRRTVKSALAQRERVRACGECIVAVSLVQLLGALLKSGLIRRTVTRVVRLRRRRPARCKKPPMLRGEWPERVQPVVVPSARLTVISPACGFCENVNQHSRCVWRDRPSLPVQEAFTRGCQPALTAYTRSGGGAGRPCTA